MFNLFFFLDSSELLTSNNLIIEASLILILSFFFTQISNKTNIPSVLMLIGLGICLRFAIDATGTEVDFFPILELLGTVGLIMIVLEAALELKLDREKAMPIAVALVIALIGLIASAFIASRIFIYFIPEISTQQAWIYATPLSILSSAIIIPSVTGLRADKKEFHIYESTFSDIFGIMMFYFLIANTGAESDFGTGLIDFGGNLLLTILVSLIASYSIVLIFQNIKSQVKLFLLIAILLLLYAIGKNLHLSSLIIILIFGLMISNMKLFFPRRFAKFLNYKKASHIYEELHIITLETAFVVRTFFFVIFGITISLHTLFNLNVALISIIIIASIYVVRYLMLRPSMGSDILPQIYIAPRGLITILLFYAIPKELQLESFNSGIILFVIIGTSLIMTAALIFDKKRSGKAIDKAKAIPIGSLKWTPKKTD
jgi:NhaP-type Na+/H+ or K+/H+ antiporter